MALETYTFTTTSVSDTSNTFDTTYNSTINIVDSYGFSTSTASSSNITFNPNTTTSNNLSNLYWDIYLDDELQWVTPSITDDNKTNKKLNEFYLWLKEEQADLEEECGMDLSGIIDKLEETFEDELSGK